MIMNILNVLAAIGATLLAIMLIGGIMFAHVQETDQLETCKRINNVYECEFIAVPKVIDKVIQ